MYDFDPKWLTKLNELRQAGENPYPSAADLPVSHVSTQLHEACVGLEEPAEAGLGVVSVGGRLMFRNKFGKAMFLRLQDRGEATVEGTDKNGEPEMKGGTIQLFVKKNGVGDEAFDKLTKLDIGDIVWCRGPLMRTRTGELTIQATECVIAAKTVAPFPDRFHGLTDVQTRSRQRYVDLFMNDGTRSVFRARSRIVRHIRDFFEDRDFLEVETPMLQTLPGGAAARPFKTHHNALDIELFLRIAPELFLKRLVVGGFDRVFEINRNFRNEGVSLKHNPEFTMLEFYQAWATYHDLMDLTEELLSGLAKRFVGDDLTVQMGEMSIDFTPPYRRAGMDELIAEHTDLSLEQLQSAELIETWWRTQHTVAEGTDLPLNRGKWWELLFDEYVEHLLVNPTFVTRYPWEISPLARRSDDDPTLTDRFELFIGTWEIANAFTELNDPVDQAERFEAQVAARAAGDDEGMLFDRDYIRALSYGMPPTAGQGIGIDRLVMLLTGTQSIREVILFPTMRPERWGSPGDDDGS